MAAPFIFIGTHKVKPGKLQEFKAWFADYVDTTIEPNEPRLLAFNAYADPDANEVTVVQVHPDAESMVHHMSVISEHIARAYADFLERDSRYQIYGTPRAGVLELMQQIDGSGRNPHQPGAVRGLHPACERHDHCQPLTRPRLREGQRPVAPTEKG